jgi:hypothetical protein
LTRLEYDQLRKVYNALMDVTVIVGAMIVIAHDELAIEDDVNTALEQSKGADNDQRSV